MESGPVDLCLQHVGSQWWLSPMPAGSYKFQFDDPDYGSYFPMHYLNHASFGDLDILSPASGSVTVLKQTMDGLPPVTSSDAVGGYKGDATISFTATDAVVGVASTYYAVDGGSFTAGTSVTVTGLGSHSVEYYSVDNLGQEESVRHADFEILPPDSFSPVPIAGTTRIETAIKAAETAFPGGADTVVIATAYNWPDALGGAALAGVYKGPILLTRTGDLPSAVSQAITDLGATKAVILGGPPAVSTDVESALASLLGSRNVTRIAGADRYRTAEAIAAKTVELLGAEYDGKALVSTGANFPDALAASPLAAAKGWPIYLVDSTKPLQTTTRQAMQAAGDDGRRDSRGYHGRAHNDRAHTRVVLRYSTRDTPGGPEPLRDRLHRCGVWRAERWIALEPRRTCDRPELPDALAAVYCRAWTARSCF